MGLAYAGLERFHPSGAIRPVAPAHARRVGEIHSARPVLPQIQRQFMLDVDGEGRRRGSAPPRLSTQPANIPTITHTSFHLPHLHLQTTGIEGRNPWRFRALILTESLDRIPKSPRFLAVVCPAIEAIEMVNRRTEEAEPSEKHRAEEEPGIQQWILESRRIFVECKVVHDGGVLVPQLMADEPLLPFKQIITAFISNRLNPLTFFKYESSVWMEQARASARYNDISAP